MHTTLRLPAVRCLVTTLMLISLLGLLSQPVRAVHSASLAPSATVTVTDCSESALRAAITNAGAGGTVLFNIPAACTITLLSTIVISQSVTLNASGSPQPVTISGGDKVEVFQVNNGVSFTLNRLTIAYGNSQFGGGIGNFGGTVTISQSTIANNTTLEGGGIENESGTVTISQSTIANNTATDGGGIDNNPGTVTISQSTIANNTAFTGGGINNNGGTVTISQSTIAKNMASSFVAGIYSNGGTVTVAQSIVANNGSRNCFGITDQGYNLESGTDCGFTGTGDQQNKDPKLASDLADNGGPTQTLALRDGSPAINKIPTNVCAVTTDQRGVSRPQGPACDIGAFEFHVPILNLPSSPITVNATSPQGTTVTYTVTASLPDDPSSAPTVSCTPPSGSTFLIGTTTVQCQARDQANPPDVTTGSFQVIVQSAQSPVQQVPPPNEPYEPYGPGHHPYGPGYGSERPHGPGHRPYGPDGPSHRPDRPGHRPDGPWW